MSYPAYYSEYDYECEQETYEEYEEYEPYMTYDEEMAAFEDSDNYVLDDGHENDSEY